MHIIQIFCNALILLYTVPLECKLFLYWQNFLFNDMSLDINFMLHVDYLFVFQYSDARM